MKIISDIRLYKSSKTLSRISICSKATNLALHRVAMKLREQGFSMGDFDHLYLNFTVCLASGTIISDDSADDLHTWYRYFDIGIEQADYDSLESDDCTNFIICQVEVVLLKLFGSDDLTETLIKNAIAEARKGSEMLMRFKEKKSAKGTAAVYLRLWDDGKYHPLLCVTDLDGKEVLRADLPQTTDLITIGEILLSSKKVTVKPRKNEFTKEAKPISFEIKL